MRLLLFSDLHCNAAAAEALVARASQADVLIGAGDFGNGRRDVEVCIDILKAVQRPTVLVAGNNESTEELAAACAGWPTAHVLHGTGVILNGMLFFGIGGGIPVTPFGAWSYDFSEQQASGLLKNCPPGGVLVSHSPPHGTVDVASSGKHLGSRSVLAAIKRVNPRLVVCGHIHGSAGEQAILGKTVVINAGPQGIEYELPA